MKRVLVCLLALVMVGIATAGPIRKSRGLREFFRDVSNGVPMEVANEERADESDSQVRSKRFLDIVMGSSCGSFGCGGGGGQQTYGSQGWGDSYGSQGWNDPWRSRGSSTYNNDDDYYYDDDYYEADYGDYEGDDYEYDDDDIGL